MTTTAPGTFEDLISRAATDEERAELQRNLPTEAEFREALAEGERHRAALESLDQGTAIASHVLFK